MTVSHDRSSGGYVVGLRSGRPAGYERRYSFDSWLLTGGVLVLGLCMLAVRSGEVGGVESSVFQAINGLSDALRTPMWVFQVFGSLAVVAVVAVAAVAAGRLRLGSAVAAAIPLKLALEWWVVKALIERERPFFTVPDAIIRDANTSPLGFPSGHAILAFALAGLLAPYLGRRGAAFIYTLAVLNALARIYLGAHNPLDVVAGAGLGIAIAAGLNLISGVPKPVE